MISVSSAVSVSGLFALFLFTKFKNIWNERKRKRDRDEIVLNIDESFGGAERKEWMKEYRSDYFVVCSGFVRPFFFIVLAVVRRFSYCPLLLINFNKLRRLTN